MSKVFICAAIPDELATREEGAVAVATAIEAGDERRARAKFHWQFLEHSLKPPSACTPNTASVVQTFGLPIEHG